MNPEPQSAKKGAKLDALIVIPAVIGFIVLLVVIVALVYLSGALNPPEQQVARIEAGNSAYDYQATPPHVDAKALAATQVALLNGYAWVDQGAGVARIPIDRAMELVPTAMIEYARQVTAVPPAPAATTESGDEIARPSNPGGAGQAVNLTGDAATGAQLFVANCQKCHGADGEGGVPNPGSDDGTVPPLNPIDDTLMSADPYTYAYNVDLFIEHGSDAEGPNPEIAMPAWGDEGRLAPQQIADVVAYIISLNPAPSAATPSGQIGGRSTQGRGLARRTPPQVTSKQTETSRFGPLIGRLLCSTDYSNSAHLCGGEYMYPPLGEHPSTPNANPDR